MNKKTIICILFLVLLTSVTTVEAASEEQQIFQDHLRSTMRIYIQKIKESIQNIITSKVTFDGSYGSTTQLPPLHITIDDGLSEHESASPNQTIRYNITFTNPSNITYESIELENIIPEQLIYEPSEHDGWEYYPDLKMVLMHCNDLPSNTSKTVFLNLTVDGSINEAMIVNNSVHIKSCETPKNTAFERTNIIPEGFTTLPIQVVKDDNLLDHVLSLETEGEQVFVNYTITIHNPNPIFLESITIYDELPPGLDDNTASPGYSGSHWLEIYLNAYETKVFYLNATVNQSVEPGSILNNRVYINHKGVVNNQTNCTTWVKETNPPMTTLSIGEPSYEKNGTLFITSQTPLTLHASDNLTYWTGVKNLTIIITNSSGTFSHTILDSDNHDMDPRPGYITHTFFLSDECLNILGFYAWDAYNNETLDGNIITFEVIDTPPDLNLSIGEPQKPCYVQMGDICYPAVSPITPIIIQTSCTHNCQHYVDLEYLTIEIYHGEQYGLWNLVQTMTIVDNDIQDIDNNNDIIQVEIHLEENCWYQIHYWAEDKLGNRNPAQGQIRTKEIFVDAQGPQSDHWFTGPQYVTAHRYITNQTIFHIRSIDLGCNGPGIGVNFTEWWLLKKQGDTWIETYREIIYDDSEHDVENTTQGILGVQISIEDDGEHYINHQSTDELGNKGPVHKHLVRVDNKPPLSSLTIGQPSCSYLNDEGEEIFCVRTNTPIRINSQDTPVGCAVGILYIEYEIYRGSQLISFGKVYDVDHIDLFLHQECSHTLWYRAVDLLNNIEEWNIQEFKVDDQKPSIQLTVMQPSIKTMHNHPHYWVRSDTIIQINGQDHGSCPVWTIRYRIDNGAWVDITDPLVRPYNLTLPHECKYTLEIEAFNCIGNTERLIKRFYVDNSAPLFHIIKPHNGIYKAGDTIHVTYYAKDLAVNSPPCYENHAVGFSSNHKAEAYIIDFRPQFMICELDTTDLKYYQDSLEYDGNIIIPSDCSIPNGSAYFVSGVSDLLHNGEHSVRDIIEHYYMTYGVDSYQFNTLIQQLTTDKKIVEIVIDNTPPDIPDIQPPVVSILNPVSDDIITTDTLYIQIQASDDKTPTKDLSVQVRINILQYHQFIINATYNTANELFEVEFYIGCIKNNSHIEIQAYATDLTGKIGVSNPLIVTIRNQVYFSQYMNKGWNQLDFGYIQGNRSIPHVFSSVQNNYTIIFELGTESYYIANQNFNILSVITPGQKYWVKMKDSQGFYLNGD